VIDAARARRELGLPAPLSLEQGLARTVAWFRERAAGSTARRSP
jgi:nucleoside-diphosphate-sugar epimerase